MAVSSYYLTEESLENLKQEARNQRVNLAKRRWARDKESEETRKRFDKNRSQKKNPFDFF